jgi:hypothetical protein
MEIPLSILHTHVSSQQTENPAEDSFYTLLKYFLF